MLRPKHAMSNTAKVNKIMKLQIKQNVTVLWVEGSCFNSHLPKIVYSDPPLTTST